MLVVLVCWSLVSCIAVSVEGVVELPLLSSGKSVDCGGLAPESASSSASLNARRPQRQRLAAKTVRPDKAHGAGLCIAGLIIGLRALCGAYAPQRSSTTSRGIGILRAILLYRIDERPNAGLFAKRVID